jgi:F-type H+-transporting ATPase subunit alpha
MAELTLDTGDIAAALRSNLEGWSPSLESETMGYVLSVGDGVARVAGLPNAMASELLEFPGGLLGVALNLDEDSIGTVILGDASGIEEGNEVRSTGKVLSIPVGDELLGRVVDPLGNPIDGKGELNATETRLLETQAPSVVERQPVSQPLQTGIKAIDAMTPIGRGQRQLIIGDRQTGKTAIVVDTILAQKGLGVKCIYVAIGQKNSTVAEVVDTLDKAGAMEYTVVVNASAGDAAALQMYAPYAGSAIGQHWMYKGEDALVIFDDLTKQAIAYREISLLLRRPPGREAYPGDVFYLHSRLLERAARMSDELGGGSLTALPIIETKAGDVSAYIPTNVISITDGQIFLETDLFFSGVRPAINAGISVSRVGGAAQVKAMRTVAGPLRLNLAQFRELEAFAEFGSELDAVSLAQLDRGRRVVEVLKQGQYDPVPVEEQVLIIFAVTGGQMDDVSPADIPEFESELREFARARYGSVLAGIADTGDLPEEELTGLIDTFKDVWTPGGASAADAARVAVSQEQAAKAMRNDSASTQVGEA